MAKKGFFSWFRKDKSKDEIKAAPTETVIEDKVQNEKEQLEARALEEAKAAQTQQEKVDSEVVKEAEKARLDALKAEEEQLAAEKAADEQARQALERAAIKAEEERLAAEKAAADEQARQALERAAIKAEEERLAAEKAAADEQARQALERATVKAEEERLAAEKAAADEQARQALERATVKAEEERLAAEKAAADEQARQALERATVKVEEERLAAEKAAADEQARQALERAAIKAEEERLATEKAEIEEQARQALERATVKAEEERLATEKAENNEQEVQPEPQAKPAKEGFFARLKRGLKRTSDNIGSGFIGLFRGKKIDDDLFEELEEQLLIADVGVETTTRLIDTLTDLASRKQLKDGEALYDLLREEMQKTLEPVSVPLVPENNDGPFVILMVGVNGVGKTTTIGKLAKQYQAQGKSVMLAAGDTFRAAAVEQLQVWGQRNDIPVVAQHTGADSASVLFDALQSAKARNIDVLIADTAGRLQNKSHLMDELKKVVRVMKKQDANAPHEVMLTLDASTGQNAISQAQLFKEAVGVTGITISKLDGTAKGGVIFAIADKFGIPIRHIGVGEQIEDLRTFNAKDFIDALFSQESMDNLDK
ncbi:signal recognition particle-docking protein FtsY [uncultured Shewanella sp.]|uniref:signal recognition particle-docking protein FtsY n=1 Tax=uncultured Shewanella sp. TaxID=173975 RepID=UPI00263411FB|nr:signal recognition particle-docking protein FtsY [uncultured Shewanella sp.]